MVTNALGVILQELGKSSLIPISDLHPDRNNSCLIKLRGGVEVQIEPDKSGENLLIGCDLGDLPGGRYRENLFREALKSNGQSHPRYGTFAYSKRTDHLILYETLNMQDLTGDKVAEFLVKFVEKALVWKNAMKNGDIPTISNIRTSKFGGIFGLKP